MRKIYIKKTNKNLKNFIKNLLFGLLLLICFLLIYSNQIMPTLIICAESYLNIEINRKVNDAVLLYLEKDGQTPYLDIKYSADGKVASVNSYVDKVNKTRASVSKIIIDELSSGSISNISLPFGCIFGTEYMYARGPRISFKIISSDNFVSSVKSRFFEQGINQTLHSIYLNFDVTVTLSLPLKNVKIPLSVSYLISEMIIVGDVPEAFTEISREFDDITESEIDDINDFGAQR